MKRMTMSVLAAAAAVVASLVTGVGIASASGMTGSYISGEGTCDFGRISARSPQVSPSVQSYSSGSTFVLGGSQWVAFRAHLARWNGSQWVEVAAASWRAKAVPLQGDPAINSYYDYATGQWGSGGSQFAISQPGYYAVYFELYWFGNQHVSSGYTSDWASAHRELRTNVYDQGAKPYCQY